MSIPRRWLIIGFLAPTIAVLAGWVSSPSQDYTVVVSRRAVQLTPSGVGQSFVAKENGLSAVRLILRAAVTGPTPFSFTLVGKEAESGNKVFSSTRQFSLTGEFASYVFPFAVQKKSGNRRYDIYLYPAGKRDQRLPVVEVAASTRDIYPRGQALGNPKLPAGGDLLFATEVDISPWTALKEFGSRLLADKLFLVFYVLLIVVLVTCIARLQPPVKPADRGGPQPEGK